MNMHQSNIILRLKETSAKKEEKNGKNRKKKKIENKKQTMKF